MFLVLQYTAIFTKVEIHKRNHWTWHTGQEGLDYWHK